MAADHLLVGLIVTTDFKAERGGLDKKELLTLHDAPGALGLTGEDADSITLLAQVKYVVHDGAEKDRAICPFVAALDVGPLVKDIFRVVVNQYHGALVAVHQESNRGQKAPHVLVVGKIAAHGHVERVDEDDAGLNGHLVNGSHKRLEILIDVERQEFLRQMSKVRVVEWDGHCHAVHAVYEVGAFALGLDVEDVYRLGDRIGV